MTFIIGSEKKKWDDLIGQMVGCARKGNQRAIAWFQGNSWKNVSVQLFDAEKIAEIERQAFATDPVLSPEVRERKRLAQLARWGNQRQVTLTPEELAQRRRDLARERYHERKAERAAQAVPTVNRNIVWPVRSGYGNQNIST